MSINKNWMVEDNISVFDDTKHRRAQDRIREKLVFSTLLYNGTRVGAAFEKFKLSLSAEEQEVLKTMRLDTPYEDRVMEKAQRKANDS